MLIGLGVIVAAAVCGVAAGCVMWWAAHRSGLWNFVAAILFGLATVLAAVFIGYVLMRMKGNHSPQATLARTLEHPHPAAPRHLVAPAPRSTLQHPSAPCSTLTPSTLPAPSGLKTLH